MKRTIPISAFQETNSWDDENVVRDFISDDAMLVITDNTKILLIIEKIRTKSAGVFMSMNTLESVASVISDKPKRKRGTLSKSKAEKFAKILHEQSKILVALGETYKLMATALEASKDNFEEIVKEDERIKKYNENPF